MERVTELAGFNKLIAGRDGYFVANENDVFVGRAMVKYGENSELEMDLFRQIVQPGDIVAEVGANIGTHTVGMAKLAGQSGRVMAFEPQPVIYQTLCANLALNSLINVDAFHCGLGAVPSTVRVPLYQYDQQANYSGLPLDPTAQKGIEVEVKKFDDVFRYARLKLLKIDVEGMEEEVVKGASESIERFKPALYMENDRADKSESLIQTVMDLGYRLWWHIPSLYNPNNYFGETENIFPKMASLNMFCLPKATKVEMDNFTEITEPMVHPMIAAK